MNHRPGPPPAGAAGRLAGGGVARRWRPIRSWLYAPGNSPRLLEKVFHARADAVILDLEDSVPPAEKGAARRLVAEAVASHRDPGGPALFVRINQPDGAEAELDLEGVVGPGLDGLRVPKVETPQSIERLDARLTALERCRGLAVGALPLVCGIESAAGVLAAAGLAGASPRVAALAFGAADFVRDIGAAGGLDGLETLYARSHLVLASRAAGIGPPVDSVYTRLDDDAGLEASSRQGRALGFFGRSCIHPRQVPIINAVYTPTAEEVERARGVVEAAAAAEQTGTGALRLAGGQFVDAAIVRRAADLLRLAEALAPREAEA